MFYLSQIKTVDKLRALLGFDGFASILIKLRRLKQIFVKLIPQL